MRSNIQTLNRRGFTILESIMAAGILLIIVVAVTAAIAAGQQHAFEAHLRIAGTLAAEELMGRVASAGYHDLEAIHHVEPVGTMTDVDGQAFPDSFASVGRELWIVDSIERLPGLEVHIVGRYVRVRAFDAQDRTLADISRFFPQPASDSVSDADDGGGDDDGGSDGSSGGLLKWLLGR